MLCIFDIVFLVFDFICGISYIWISYVLFIWEIDSR